MYLPDSYGSPFLDVFANFTAQGRELSCGGFADGKRDRPGIHLKQALFSGIRCLPLLAPTRGKVFG
ncbi:MAG TPA: hypothetical protein VGM84_28630 [Steroidobacteraceae bacterium]